MKNLFTLLLLLILGTFGHAQKISTIAGNGINGFSGDDSMAIDAEICCPHKLLFDKLGNILFCDKTRVRRIDNNGIISTIAGNGLASDNGDGGPATLAGFNVPSGLAIDSHGNIYISDLLNNKIRKVDSNGKISIFAGTGFAGYSGDNHLAKYAEIAYPHGLAFDNTDNLYIADYGNHCIRVIDTAGIITTIAGNGFRGYSGDGGYATLAKLFSPLGIAIDNYGNVLISEQGNHCIRKIDRMGIISTIGGNGTESFSGDGFPATSATLSQPDGISVDKSNNVFIADVYNHRIRVINSSGIINTIVGTGTAGYNGDYITANTAELNTPFDIAVNESGQLYISDTHNSRIRFIGPPLKVESTVNENYLINVFPNPASYQFNILIHSSTNKELIIDIYNQIGQRIKHTKGLTDKEIQIPVDDLSTGLYSIRVYNEDIEQHSTITIIK